jgi:hypothetical protein
MARSNNTAIICQSVTVLRTTSSVATCLEACQVLVPLLSSAQGTTVSGRRAALDVFLSLAGVSALTVALQRWFRLCVQEAARHREQLSAPLAVVHALCEACGAVVASVADSDVTALCDEVLPIFDTVVLRSGAFEGWELASVPYGLRLAVMRFLASACMASSSCVAGVVAAGPRVEYIAALMIAGSEYEKEHAVAVVEAACRAGVSLADVPPAQRRQLAVGVSALLVHGIPFARASAARCILMMVAGRGVLAEGADAAPGRPDLDIAAAMLAANVTPVDGGPAATVAVDASPPTGTPVAPSMRRAAAGGVWRLTGPPPVPRAIDTAVPPDAAAPTVQPSLGAQAEMGATPAAASADTAVLVADLVAAGVVAALIDAVARSDGSVHVIAMHVLARLGISNTGATLALLRSNAMPYVAAVVSAHGGRGSPNDGCRIATTVMWQMAEVALSLTLAMASSVRGGSGGDVAVAVSAAPPVADSKRTPPLDAITNSTLLLQVIADALPTLAALCSGGLVSAMGVLSVACSTAHDRVASCAEACGALATSLSNYVASLSVEAAAVPALPTLMLDGISPRDDDVDRVAGAVVAGDSCGGVRRRTDDESTRAVAALAAVAVARLAANASASNGLLSWLLSSGALSSVCRLLSYALVPYRVRPSHVTAATVSERARRAALLSVSCSAVVNCLSTGDVQCASHVGAVGLVGDVVDALHGVESPPLLELLLRALECACVSARNTTELVVFGAIEALCAVRVRRRCLRPCLQVTWCRRLFP